MKLDEITYGSDIASLTPHLDIKQSALIGHVDSMEVYEMDIGNGICFFLYDPKDTNFLSYVASDRKRTNGFLHLRQIENVSGIKGSISSLMFFLTRKKGLRFVITSQEPLIYTGLKWVGSVISSNRQLFKITDHAGVLPDIASIEDEWEQSRIDPSVKGTISIFIESSGNKEYNGIFESTSGMLTPVYRIFKDPILE